MSKKYLTVIAIASAFVITAGMAEAYPQNTLFGTGYGFAGYNNFSNGAAETSAVNKTMKKFIESEKADNEASNNGEKPVSGISGHYDEAPNAGYKTNYRYIDKGSDDYNPYTGADSGVNDTKSIYTDDLGRIHFFGKGSLFKNNK